MSTPPGYCELCRRAQAGLTKHHLIPRTRHHNKRIKRMFSREQMNNQVLWVCRPCHNHIHRVFDEKQLALEFNTREKLINHPEINRFIRWLSDKPCGFKPRSSR